MLNGKLGSSGTVALQRIEAIPMPGAGLLGVIRSILLGLPWFGLPREVLVWRIRNIPHLWRGAWRALLGSLFRVPFVYGRLYVA